MDGNAARACDLFDQVARATAAPIGLNLPTVLALHQPWFGFSAAELTEAALERGCVPCWFAPEEPLPASAEPHAGDVDTLLGKRYRDVSLWEVARYDFCVRHELALAEAERDAAAHVDDLQREFARARALIDRAHRYCDAYAPSCALVAQGHVMASAAVRAVAHARGIRVVAIENTFHAGRLLWDDDAALPVVASRARSVWLREGGRVTDARAERYVARYLERAKQLKSAEHASPETGDPWAAVACRLSANSAPTGDRRRIVVLAQVATDAAVLFGLRRGFTRQLDVIRSVAEYAERCGHALVIKLHPKEAHGDSPLGIPYRRLSERQLRGDPTLSPQLERGAFALDADNALDTDRLCDGADVCVTINSQAGLEALVRGCEVVLCGDAFYANLGFTHEAEDAASLEIALTRALDPGAARNRDADAKRFFWTYLEQLCREKTPEAVAALCASADATPRPAEPQPPALQPTAPQPEVAVTRSNAVTAPRADRETYASGERQTALQYAAIRADHRARYDFAAEWLTPEFARARRGDAALVGLDAFCGNGYGTGRLARAPHIQMQGIDASADAIAIAERHFGSERARFHALHFPCALPAARFDFATCFESIEHVEQDEALLETLTRALVPGGLLFLSAPNEATLPIAQNADFFRFHVRHYREAQLVELAASKGLALRARAGQRAYRTEGLRACEPLAEEAMGLDAAMADPHFLVFVFEKCTPDAAPTTSTGGVRLDLGCGERGPKPGFAGVDIRPLPGVAHVGDMFALDGFFLPSSVAEIHSRHAFEHLDFAQGERALECWARVLAPGGRLHLIVPDLRFHIAQYLDPNPEGPSPANPEWTQRVHACAGFWGWQRDGGSTWDLHKSGYDFQTMRALLLRHGFVDVVRVDDDPWHLNVIATRAAPDGAS